MYTRLTTSVEMGQLIRDHCSCQVPCMCGCQALSQHVYLRQRAHTEVMLCLLQQGKVQMAVQYGHAKGALDQNALLQLLRQCPSVQLVETLLIPKESDGGKEGTLLPLGVVLTTLCTTDGWKLAKDWLQRMVYSTCSPPGKCIFCTLGVSSLGY